MDPPVNGDIFRHRWLVVLKKKEMKDMQETNSNQQSLKVKIFILLKEKSNHC